MTGGNNNTLKGLVLGYAVLLLAWFITALLDSKAGEQAAALGSVIGGIVGAGGAVLAVYLTLERQRADDTTKIRAAVRTEVTTYSKYVIGTLEICQQIATGALKIPMAEATYIGKNLIDPIIYQAVADRVALLQRPQATVEFYMRVAEAKSNLAVMQVRASGLTPAQSAGTTVQPGNAAVVAGSLITALQLAQAIISGVDPARTPMDEMVQQITLADIEASLKAAQMVFPDVESFKSRPSSGGSGGA